MRNPPLPIKLNKPSIRKLNSFEVQYFMELVKHHMIYTLDTLVAIYNQFSDIKNFTIDYEIVASNIPEKIEGKLHIIYED